MPMPSPHEYLIKSIYFAPRGRKRIHELGAHLAQRYLSAEDSLIGVIGDAGAGKSVLIQGMFPGLELTNDDMGINVRPLPLLHHYDNGIFEHHSYHLDIHFEQAFTRPPLLAEAVHKALREGCRVIVEHFDLLYPVLKMNARVLVGIGQEVVIARPGLFGPYPDAIKEQVYRSLYYRRMAHSAEDITQLVLEQLGAPPPEGHGDVHNGFILHYSRRPSAELALVEEQVKGLIAKDLTINPTGICQITIGESTRRCTGPRLHLRSTGEIENFRLEKEYLRDPLTGTYSIVGRVGSG
jgi:tRNA A37 threonylcarbamoyladenosine biosynthesis protein TsaE